MINDTFLNNKIVNVLKDYPYAGDFFIASGINGFKHNYEKTISQFIYELDESILEDIGMSCRELENNYISFINRMESLKQTKMTVNEITIIGGQNKLGQAENIQLTVKKGEIITITGPTGSGKSCLLSDIECLAQEDTHTKRKILVNGQPPDHKDRFRIEKKLIAQLTQNMNYVMDLPVIDFLRLHGESRMIKSIDNVIEEIFEAANDLAGECFSKKTPLTELSGGQSRALMIADTAFLSLSPIVLIDEIENAGVDRKKALQLLTKEQKIVLMSTHDPILALMGTKRIIIENGGIKDVLETTKAERENLAVLEETDRKMAKLLQLLRTGEKAETPFSQL